MGRKLLYMLISLLIILKEPIRSEPNCPPKSISCRLRCHRNQRLTGIPQNLSEYLSYLQINHCIAAVHVNQYQSQLLRYRNLKLLDLNSNQITMIPAYTFARLPKLEILSLLCNQITTISAGTLANLTRLRLLNLAANNITDIQTGAFWHLTSLTSLNLHRNHITMIQTDTFAKLSRLEELFLSSNQMTMIQTGTFANLSQLKALNLCGNQITMIQAGTFHGLTRLLLLKLGENQITKIEAGAFTNLTQLHFLSLYDNKITMIQSGVFSNLPQLKILHLHRNNMSVIPPPVFGFLSTSMIQLDGNPWQCDCRMVPLRLNITTFPSFPSKFGWFDKYEFPPVPPIKDQIVCAQPTKFKGKNLTNINPEEMTCEEQTISTPTVDIQVTSDIVNNDIATSHYQWCFTRNTVSAVRSEGNMRKTRATQSSPFAITSDRPECNSSHDSTPNIPRSALVGYVLGSVTGTLLIGGTVFLTIWYTKKKKKIRHPHTSGTNPNVAGTNTNTALAIEDLLSFPNPFYASQGGTEAQMSTTMASGPDQTGQGQSQTATECNSNTTAYDISHDHQYEDVDRHYVNTRQRQNQATTETNTNTTATAMTSARHYTALCPLPDASCNDKTEQYQSQATTVALVANNLSYGTGPTASQLNSLYVTP